MFQLFDKHSIRYGAGVALGTFLTILVAPGKAMAHAGHVPTPGSIWTVWNWDPVVIVPMLTVGLLYTRGVRAIWAVAGGRHAVRPGQVASFTTAMVILFIAVVSPLDPLGEALFSAHMVQHLLLMLVAAPLLVIARPMAPIVRGLPDPWRRAAGRIGNGRSVLGRISSVLISPPVAWTLHAIAIWIWHMPLFYEAAIQFWLVHLLEHAMFLGTGVLFWWSVLPLPATNASTARGIPVLSLFTTALHSGLLAALLTFSSAAWYTSHAASVEPWGLTPLQDQQLAGVVMWVPMGAVYTFAAALVLGQLLRQLSPDEPENNPGRPVSHAPGPH